jgi:hypothetical protein
MNILYNDILYEKEIKRFSNVQAHEKTIIGAGQLP